MAVSDSSGIEKLDALLKESKAANRMAARQFVVSLVALVPGVAAALANLGSVEVAIAFVFPTVLVVAAFAAYYGSTGNGPWYERVEARERARLLDKYALMNFGTHLYHDTYVASLRMHYQFALVEGRRELAEYLRQELEAEERPRAKAHETAPQRVPEASET